MVIFDYIFLSTRLHFNLSVNDRNIYGSQCWEVFGNFRLSSNIIGKYSDTFIWPSDNFLAIFGNLRKLVGSLSNESPETSYVP